MNQSILAVSKRLGFVRLLDKRGLIFRSLACFLKRLRATMTGTEDLVTR